VITPEHLQWANTFLRLESAYRSSEDLIAVGAYKSGADKLADAAIALRDEMNNYLRQSPGEGIVFEESRARLAKLAEKAG
jgi:flagellum-specific ATP synthase